MTEPLQLEPATYERIVALCAEGDAHADAGRHRPALERYAEAWALIPDPKENWDAATWVIAAIADCWFLSGRYDEVLRALEFGMNCPGAVGNPFLHLRLGQALFEQGDEDRAADELIRAYAVHGEEIFAHEDPKYLAFLATRAKLES